MARTTGEVELEEKVLVLRRIHVRLELRCTPDQREAAERVHRVFARSCPLYRSLSPAIGITTEIVFVS